MLGEPHLQRAHQRARRILDQMREAIVGTASRQWRRIDCVLGAALMARDLMLSAMSRLSRAERKMASRTSSVAIAHAPSCRGALPCTTAA